MYYAEIDGEMIFVPENTDLETMPCGEDGLKNI
jgi:hypothetical protein